MSCVEKRHMSHRVGSMLHHRFPNGFTDLFMDETDREVSTLTDRAFRSLCVGDEAVYNDEFLYGYSPFSCHKPLAGEPVKKTHRKSNKKQSKNESSGGDQPWKKQQQANISQMSSFLKALSVKEESRDGVLSKNGGAGDPNCESWDQSALRSIERELSEFSSNYHSDLTDGHYKGDKASKLGSNSSQKSNKMKNGKSTVKLKKLNIKNFFLHSEFSPFQSWGDLNRFPFTQEDCSIIPADNIPKWCDLPFYKELTQAHIKNTQRAEETKTRDEAIVELQPPANPKPIRCPSPPKVLPKPSINLAQIRCSSNGGADGTVAPWRRNRSRATSAVPIHESVLPSKELSSSTVDGIVPSVRNEGKSFEVKSVKEVSSVSSTPFSICQLMTPQIPSRQATETSEILQNVFSPSMHDLPLTPNSDTKLTPEPPVKRDSYKSLASSILFNLKDNRKRVKSRYSPPKFRNLDTPPSNNLKPYGSEDNSPGLTTPAVTKEVPMVQSPAVESGNTPLIISDADRPLSVDYLLSNILQTKGEAGEIKKDRSPNVKRQNYPSLNLYKKSSPVDKRYLHVPSSIGDAVYEDELREISENSLKVKLDKSPLISPSISENKEPLYSEKIPFKVPENVHKPMKQIVDREGEIISPKRKDNQHMSTMDVIKAAKEAISAAKTKALSVGQSENMKAKLQGEPMREDYTEEKINIKQSICDTDNVISLFVGETKKEPPPVPKRNFAKSDIQQHLKSPVDSKENVQREKKLKHVFSARQNNYIKNQRYSVTDEEHAEGSEQGVAEVQGKSGENGEMARETRDNDQISYDLQALKELERARLGSRAHESGRNKLAGSNIDEDARAKSDLISRELQNIKKGMMSMRGNTLAKREIFAKKENDRRKQDTYAKIDNNLIVNKALFNGNYDKAKMALEEIITDRQERRHKTTGKDFEMGSDESHFSKIQQSKADISSPNQQKSPQEWSGDLQDQNNVRQNLPKTEARIGETHRSGGRIPLPGMADVEHSVPLKTKAKREKNEMANNSNYDSQLSDVENARQSDCIDTNKSKILQSPAIPPRHKKIGIRKDRQDDVSNVEAYGTGDTLSVNAKCKDVEQEVDDGKTKPLETTVEVTSHSINDVKTEVSSEINQKEAKDNDSNSLTKERLEKMAAEIIDEAVSEPPRSVTSPLVLVNGISFSPPDQASLSSKSSYFSVDSTLQRNTETESNVFHSMENLYEKLLEEEKSEGKVQSSKGDDGQYYHLNEKENVQPMHEDVKEIPPVNAPLSPQNMFSPTLGIPALFKIKDNTCPQRAKKTLQPWSPRSTLSGSEKEEIDEEKRNVATVAVEENIPKDGIALNKTQILPVQEILINHLPPSPQASHLDEDDQKKPQLAGLLTVPRDEDAFSGASPYSEGMESVATSNTETADEMGLCEAAAEQEVSTIPSECSGSTCSGYESLPKPPAVLPKSEKAVLKAIKLTHRRIKKDEARKSSHDSRRHKGETHRGDKSEHRSGRSKDRKHRDTTSQPPTRGQEEQGRVGSDPQKKSSDSGGKGDVDGDKPNVPKLRDRNSTKELQRQLSSDQVISSVPVYKANIHDRPMSDKPLQRSVSIDRYLSDKSQRRHSEDMSIKEKLDPRRQRIEKSIMDELQQRGRARERTSRDNPLRRSHSIDTSSSNGHRVSDQSFQPGNTNQLSRQSSIDFVTQSFPMTQRKLLQDPDSGQYFFVDMPVQVKTKTFFDPETGTYVQLPVQPSDGAVLQAPTMEVLTPPMVVYHSFVPVSLSPMTQNSAVKNPYADEQRLLEKSRKMNCKDPYLEPVYGQHDNILGEFLGTEELDCPS